MSLGTSSAVISSLLKSLQANNKKGYSNLTNKSLYPSDVSTVQARFDINAHPTSTFLDFQWLNGFLLSLE